MMTDKTQNTKNVPSDYLEMPQLLIPVKGQ